MRRWSKAAGWLICATLTPGSTAVLNGAGRAGDMTAFADNDLSSVDTFLGPDVAEAAAAIAERQAAGQKLDTRTRSTDRRWMTRA